MLFLWTGSVGNWGAVEVGRVQKKVWGRNGWLTVSASLSFKQPLGMEIIRNFFSQRVVDPWNSLSEAIRRSSTVNSFKNNYDQWVLGGG